MNGVHINWTKPSFVRGAKAYEAEAHELLTTVLSALNWKKLYGPVYLYADRAGLEYYERVGYLPLWDGVKELAVPESVSAVSYWAAGKLYALADMDAPVAMLDTDLILWERVELSAPLTVAHFEPVGNDIYPAELSYYDVDLPEFYELDARAPACNTAFCCFTDAALKERYLTAAKAFMERSRPGENTLQYMVCAEQRLLGMLARQAGVMPQVLLTPETLRTQTVCTHTWGYKASMRGDDAKQFAYCVRLARRIAADYPDWAARLMKVEKLYPYFHAIS